MSHALNVYRSVNDLAYNELYSPARTALRPAYELDEDAIQKENAEAFLRFELAITQISGVQDQLEAYAVTQENLALDGEQHVEEDSGWTLIQDEVKDQINEVGFKLHNDHADEFDDFPHGSNNPVAKVVRHTEALAKTGVADQSFLSALLPSSTQELVESVRRRTGLNTIIGWWTSRNAPPEDNSVVGDNTESLRQAERIDALYNLLAAHYCHKNGHETLIQLLGCGDSHQEENVFQMFLSDCSNNTLQKATCVFESERCALDDEIDICTSVKIARRSLVPVQLCFNHKALWKAQKKVRFLSEHQERANTIDLKTILSQRELSASDQDANVSKFRFALRLALSLNSLIFGPWFQQGLNSHSIRVLLNGNSSWIKMLDEAYISCRVTLKWNNISPPPGSDLEVKNDEICPRFFLSFAQLLLDIIDGTETSQPPEPENNEEWYRQLVYEVRRRKENDHVMEDYWEAVQGCLQYQINYENHDQISGYPDKEERLRAQTVILKHIIRPLQKNLEDWKQQEIHQKHRDCNGSTGHEQKNLAQCSISSPNPEGMGMREIVESKFTLWFEQDDEFKEIDEPAEDPSPRSFVTLMKGFKRGYIDELPEPSGNKDIDKPIRVAVIDTGFFIEESDLNSDGDFFLSNSAVSGRVKDRRNFFSRNNKAPDPDDWKDTHGHGTLVARLVLEFAPRAEVIVARVSDSKSLGETYMTQLVNALKWAGDRADIINLSFSLGSMPKPEVETVIEDLISRQKLIFAAASNEGSYGSRKWPAKRDGVFAIHATNEFGVPGFELNPPIKNNGDNFAAFGIEVKSYWNGKHRSISGTSFASPVAAAIAANVLEIARRTLPEPSARGLARYGAMRTLFREHMVDVVGGYHVLKPWIPGLWDGNTPPEKIKKKIWKLII